jgi:ornithine decarboxylase
MITAQFVLSKKVLKEQVKTLKDLGLKISYSYKTNRIVGKVLQELKEGKNVYFSIHAQEEIDEINDKSKIWFFTQAESEEELCEILNKQVRNFVVDNEIDFERLLKIIEKLGVKINLSLRMKFQEHRIGTGKYFVYGMPSRKINELILKIKNNKFIEKLGIHLHRKSQNTSEWEIIEELKDSLTEETLKRINFVNLGGGLPSIYRSSNVDVLDYIFSKLKTAQEWLEERGIETIIEPGRFLAAPCVRLIVEVIQKYDNNLIVNTTLYNCALDNLLTGTKMLVEGELSENEEGEYFLIKGNSPTRDDIFRYKVKLNKNIKVGNKIVFLNAGAYNYTTDFFGYNKLDTIIKEDF